MTRTASPANTVLHDNPKGELRMSGNLSANGGLIARELHIPDFHDLAVDVPAPGTVRFGINTVAWRIDGESTSRNPSNFRLFCPDETDSNRLGAVFDVSDRAFMESTFTYDTDISANGRVMEVLSENNCRGAGLRAIRCRADTVFCHL